jgi:hypothetical protein
MDKALQIGISFYTEALYLNFVTLELNNVETAMFVSKWSLFV